MSERDPFERKCWNLMQVLAWVYLDTTPRELLAPADRPDPFGKQWWNLMQVLAWVYLGNRAVVRAAGPQGAFNSTLTIRDLRVLGRLNGACYLHFENAEEAAIDALQAGRLTATGLLNGERDDRNEIPPLSWADLVFRYQPYYFAGPKDPTRTRPYWDDLQFPRKEVLAVWADPLESLAMADEPVVVKADRGSTNAATATRETVQTPPDTKDAKIAELTQERDSLRERVPELEQAAQEAPKKAKPLLTKERQSALKLIIGMAIKGYQYDPAEERKDTTGKISRDIESLGISLDADTVRKWLREAEEVLPSKAKKT